MFYGGLVFLTGWIMRAVFARDPSSLSLYIAQTVLVLCGPPIFAATEYNILARIMRYLPMHAPIGPNRVIFFFTYLSALVESLTAAGGGMMARTDAGIERVKKGSTLVAIAIVLQAVVQIVFASVVAIMHRRTVRANMLTSNVRTVFIMLYGTSVLVIIRCVYRAVEKFSRLDVLKTGICRGPCKAVLWNEWYLYAFEAAPMVLYMMWINIIHPGRFLPRDKTRFLDYNKVERIGPQDKKVTIRWMSLLDMGLGDHIENPKDRFWERPDEWEIVQSNGHTKTKSKGEENITTKV